MEREDVTEYIDDLAFAIKAQRHLFKNWKLYTVSSRIVLVRGTGPMQFLIG